MSTDNTPSRNEDEYFLRQDDERIKAQRAKLDAERAAAERSTHFMKCPKCGGDLKETEYEHLKVDVCTDCKGVWFDAGEIDMLSRVNKSAIGSFMSALLKKGFHVK